MKPKLFKFEQTSKYKLFAPVSFAEAIRALNRMRQGKITELTFYSSALPLPDAWVRVCRENEVKNKVVNTEG